MLYDQVSNDIKEAMKARDKVRLETLRNIKKVFIEAKTAPGANDTLEDAAALKILAKLAKQGKESAETFRQQNREDLAEEELAQVRVISPQAAHGRRDRGKGKGNHRPDRCLVNQGDGQGDGRCQQADGRQGRRQDDFRHREETVGVIKN